jgi:hypothetical protein
LISEGLLAVGFSPIIRLIERQRFLPIGTRRRDGWRYRFTVHHRCARRNRISMPPLHQGQQLEALPQMFERAQDSCRKVLLRERLTIQRQERAPVSKGGDAVTTAPACRGCRLVGCSVF